MSKSDTVHVDNPEPEALRSRVGRAVRTVRREGAKAATVHAIVDAAVIFIVVNLLSGLFFSVTNNPVETVALPPTIIRRAWNIGLYIPESFPIGLGVLTATGLAISIFIVEFVVLYRRYTLEKFETMNPVVREAFRTARDAASDGEDTVMAQELFQSVLRDLQSATSQKFVNGRRLTMTIVVLLLVSLGVLGVSVTGFHIDLNDNTGAAVVIQPGTGGGGAGTGGSPNDVLGERTEVERGTQQQAIQLDGEEAEAGGATGGSYESSGFSVDPQEVDAVAAEYTNEGELEDSELIREYNQRIRGLEQN